MSKTRMGPPPTYGARRCYSLRLTAEQLRGLTDLADWHRFPSLNAYLTDVVERLLTPTGEPPRTTT